MDPNDILGAIEVDDVKPEVQTFDELGDPIKQEGAEPPKAEEPAPAEPKVETPAPQSEDQLRADLLAYKNLAQEQQQTLDELRSALPLLQKLKENPNSAELIQAFVDGDLDEDALRGRKSKNVDPLDEWLEDESNTDDGTEGTERKAPATGTPEVDKDSDEYKGVVEKLNGFVVSKRGEGVTEADLHRFLSWLPNGKPQVEDLWYAFVAQSRREGRPVQPVRSKTKELAVEGVNTTGGSDRPAPEAPQTLSSWRDAGFHEEPGDANAI